MPRSGPLSRGPGRWLCNARSGGRLAGAVLCMGMLLGLTTATGAATSAPTWRAHGSAEQIYVLGLPAGAPAELLDSNGHVVPTQNPEGQTATSQVADSLGGLLFRKVLPGTGYRVIDVANGVKSGPITVHSDQAAPWDPSIYNQRIKDSGYQYLTTRDGTKLAIDVHPPTSPAGLSESLPTGQNIPVGLPPGTTLPPGPDYAPPYPTLIEYSGYGYADPAGPENGIAILANLMGFAVVDVNMRGTGCSGGAFNFFEPLQSLDGYDVIETIAHQPWVLGHKVGMLGISYGAISQLFVAATDPPALAAIAPLSTIDATATTLYPGGILNTGFAVAWAEQRQSDAEPAGPDGGQPWAYQQIEDGDTTCQANQALHGKAANLMGEIEANNFYNPSIADPLDPITFVDKINVPVFMACQWEDEQTGGHCADLVQHFTGTKLKWFTFTNGAHIDSLDPSTYDDWYDFLELFVAHRAPIVNQVLIRAAAPLIYQEAMGVPDNDEITLPADPIQGIPTYSAALAAFERIPSIRVLFDNGAGTSPTGQTTAGNPYPAFEQYFSAAPASEPGALVSGTTAETWYLDRVRSESSATMCRRRAASIPTRRTRRLSHSPTSAATPVQAACGATHRSGNGTGSRTPLARRCRGFLPLWRRTRRSSAQGRCTSGWSPPHRMWTCKRPSASCDRTATKRSSRTAGSAPVNESSRRARTTCSSRRAPCSARFRPLRQPTPHRCRVESS
jgi:uncharacterized protein